MSVRKKDVGMRIRSIRKSLGLTMEEFGKKIDEVHPASDSIVSRWERGVSLPNNDRIPKIAELGDISVDYLLHGKDIWDEYDKSVDLNHLTQGVEFQELFKGYFKSDIYHYLSSLLTVLKQHEENEEFREYSNIKFNGKKLDDEVRNSLIKNIKDILN